MHYVYEVRYNNSVQLFENEQYAQLMHNAIHAQITNNGQRAAPRGHVLSMHRRELFGVNDVGNGQIAVVADVVSDWFSNVNRADIPVGLENAVMPEGFPNAGQPIFSAAQIDQIATSRVQAKVAALLSGLNAAERTAAVNLGVPGA